MGARLKLLICGWVLEGGAGTAVPMNAGAEPLFVQVARFVQNLIVDGTLRAGDRAPSTNELAAFHEINPATARKGLSLLGDAGVLTKRRGLGMFVTEGACDLILAQRRAELAGAHIAALIDEALRLGCDRVELYALINNVAKSRGMYR